MGVVGIVFTVFFITLLIEIWDRFPPREEPEKSSKPSLPPITLPPPRRSRIDPRYSGYEEQRPYGEYGDYGDYME